MTDHHAPCPRNMPSRVCTTHDLKRVKNLPKVLNAFKSCAVCKCRTRPWTTIVKCKGCKMVGHRRCLQNDETSSRGADEENGAAEEPTAEQPNCDDGAIGVQSNATATAASVTVRVTEDESTSEGARARGVFVPPPNPSALPPLLPPPTTPYDLPSNITVTDKTLFEDGIWYTISVIKKTFDDGHKEEYHMVTCSNFKDNVTLTVCLKLIGNSMNCVASSSVRTCVI